MAFKLRPWVKPPCVWLVLAAALGSLCYPASGHVYVRDNTPGLGLGLVMYHIAKIFEACDRAGTTASFTNCRKLPDEDWVRQNDNNFWVPQCTPDRIQVQDFYERAALTQQTPPLPVDARFVRDAAPDEWCPLVQALGPGGNLVMEFPDSPPEDSPACNISMEDACPLVARWFDKPVGKLAALSGRIEANIHREFSFHLRVFDEADGMLTFDEGLNPSVTGRCKVFHDCDDRVQDQVQVFSLVKDFIHNISSVAAEALERTGKKTFLATDSNAVKKYISRKHYAFETHISHNNEQSVGNIGHTAAQDKHNEYLIRANALLYGIDSIVDFHTLSLTRLVYTFPVESSFSKYAACRGGGENIVCDRAREWCYLHGVLETTRMD